MIIASKIVMQRWVLLVTCLVSQQGYSQFEVLDIPVSGSVYIACGGSECMISDWHEFIGITSNLGETFDTLEFPYSSYSVSSVQHTTDSTYYLAGVRTDTLHQTVVYKSTNGGHSWQHIFEKPYSTSVFYMHNDSFGIVGTGLGALYRTTDGWETYDSTQYSINSQFMSAYFLNDSVGFVGGKGSALYTADSGSNWIGGYFAYPSTFIRGFGQTNDTTIFATGSPNQQQSVHIFRSTDIGATKEIVFESKFEGRSIWGIECFPNGECIAVGKNASIGKGILYRTLDGGDTWYEIEVPTSKMLYHIEFANDSIALLGGEEGTLIRMNRNLLPQPPDTNDTTNSINYIGNQPSLSIYPNPTESTHQIDLPIDRTGHCTLQLYNAQGVLIETVRVEPDQKQFDHDASQLASGIYFYRVQTSTGAYQARFIKE